MRNELCWPGLLVEPRLTLSKQDKQGSLATTTPVQELGLHCCHLFTWWVGAVVGKQTHISATRIFMDKLTSDSDSDDPKTSKKYVFMKFP